MRKINTYIPLVIMAVLLILVLASAFFPAFFAQFYAGWSWANFILIVIGMLMSWYYQHHDYTITVWSDLLFLVADVIFFLTTMVVPETAVPDTKNIIVWVNQYTPWIVLLTAFNISFIFWAKREEK